MPGGTRTVRLALCRTRPPPLHAEQALSTTRPAPPQCGQAWLIEKNPWENWTRPAPRQVAHCLRPVPGLAPEPLHLGHPVTRSYSRLTVLPL